jgi:hypothetical protein
VPENNIQFNTPEEHYCPISGEIMSNPVCTPFGHTFDLNSICSWIAIRPVCPMTGYPLWVSDLQVDHEMRQQMGLEKMPDHELEYYVDPPDTLPEDYLDRYQKLMRVANASNNLISIQSDQVPIDNNTPVLFYTFNCHISFTTKADASAEQIQNSLDYLRTATLIDENIVAINADKPFAKGKVSREGIAPLTPRGTNFIHPQVAENFNDIPNKKKHFNDIVTNTPAFDWTNTKFSGEVLEYAPNSGHIKKRLV